MGAKWICAYDASDFNWSLHQRMDSFGRTRWSPWDSSQPVCKFKPPYFNITISGSFVAVRSIVKLRWKRTANVFLFRISLNSIPVPICPHALERSLFTFSVGPHLVGLVIVRSNAQVPVSGFPSLVCLLPLQSIGEWWTAYHHVILQILTNR